MKEKYHIEYVFGKVSKQSLWRHISTPVGLSEWFAEDVRQNGNEFSFIWSSDSEEIAMMLSLTEGERIRFRWQDEAKEKTFFELSIHELELTGDCVLEVTDFAEKGERTESIEFWDTLVERLQLSLGIL